MDRKHVRGLLSFLGFETSFQGVLSLKMPGYLAQGAGRGLAQSTFAPVKERVNSARLMAGREVLQPKLMQQDQKRAAYVIS